MSVEFEATKPIESATLITTMDSGFTGRRTWEEKPAEIERRGRAVIATGTLPPGTRAWFINVNSGKLIASSDFVTSDP